MVDKTSVRKRRRIIPSGGTSGAAPGRAPTRAPVAVPGLRPEGLRPRRRLPAKDSPASTTPAERSRACFPPVPPAPHLAPEPPTEPAEPTTAKGRKKAVETIDPAELRDLFQRIWKLHSKVETLSADLKSSSAELQWYLKRAYSLVGGTVMQAEDGRTFRLRPVGTERTFVFIWENAPQRIVKV